MVLRCGYHTKVNREVEQLKDLALISNRGLLVELSMG